jgi:hypothetical protein
MLRQGGLKLADLTFQLAAMMPTAARVVAANVAVRGRVASWSVRRAAAISRARVSI